MAVGGDAELGALLERILEAAERIVALVPTQRLEYGSPSGNRSVGDLAFHLFRLSAALVDAMDRGRLSAEWLREKRPPDLIDGRAVARYGALVRGRVSGWFEGAGPSELSRVIDADDGPLDGHGLLERTTRHAARHLRELHAMGERLGLAVEPLPVDLAPSSSPDA